MNALPPDRRDVDLVKENDTYIFYFVGDGPYSRLPQSAKHQDPRAVLLDLRHGKPPAPGCTATSLAAIASPRHIVEAVCRFWWDRGTPFAIFDIGSHAGRFAIEIGNYVRYCGKQVPIVAVEPGPTWPLIRHSVALNGLSSLVEVKNLALSDVDGPLLFAESDTETNTSSLWRKEYHQRTTVVGGVSFETALGWVPGKTHLIAKIDAEGAEPLILSEVARLRERVRVVAICSVVPWRLGGAAAAAEFLKRLDERHHLVNIHSFLYDYTLRIVGADDIEPLMREVSDRAGGFTDFLLLPRDLEGAAELMAAIRRLASDAAEPAPPPPAPSPPKAPAGTPAEMRRPIVVEPGLRYVLHDEAAPNELPPGATVFADPDAAPAAAAPDGSTAPEGADYLAIVCEHFRAQQRPLEIVDLQSWCGRFALRAAALSRRPDGGHPVTAIGNPQWARLVALSAQQGGVEDRLEIRLIGANSRAAFVEADLDLAVLRPYAAEAGGARRRGPAKEASGPVQRFLFTAPEALGTGGLGWLKRRAAAPNPAIELVVVRQLSLARLNEVSEVLVGLLPHYRVFYMPDPDMEPRLREVLPGTAAAHAFLAARSPRRRAGFLVVPRSVADVDELAAGLQRAAPADASEPRPSARPATGTAFFIHIPKTGGQSLWQMVAMNIGTGPSLTLTGHEASVTQFHAAPAATKVAYRAVYGHFKHGLHRGLTHEVRYFTWLRDPVQRVVSEFLENKWQPASADYRRIQEGMTLLEWLADAAGTPWKRNLQCKFIGGDSLRGVPEERHVAVARDNLAAMTGVGLTERFDETILLFAKSLGWSRLIFGVANRSREQIALTPAVLEACRPLVEQDQQLYALAAELFGRRVAEAGEEFAAALAAYQAVLAEARQSANLGRARMPLGEPVDRDTWRVNDAMPLPPAVRRFLAG